MVRELQENTDKQFNEIRKIQEQNEKYNKKTENIRQYQTSCGAEEYNH